MALDGPESFRVRLDSPETTARFAERLAEVAPANLVVGLVGELGAGKTMFVKAFRRALGPVGADPVSSPTFVLVHEYEGGRLPVFHFDTYRLADADAFGELGAEEYFEGGGVSFVEWADRVADWLPDDRLTISFTHAGEQARLVSVGASGPAGDAVARRWRDALASESMEFLVEPNKK